MKINIFFLAAVCLILSCDKEKTDLKEIDGYPVAIGNEWLYDYSGKFLTASGEEKNYNYEIRVKIEKDTVLNDTMNVLIFKAFDSYPENVSTSYMFMDTAGLKNYAYENPGMNVFALNQPEQFLFQTFHTSIKKKSFNSNDIFYESIPRLNLPLPLHGDSKWTYLEPSGSINWQIDKEVVGIENISLHGKNYTCFKVRWIYVKSSLSSTPEITDWICEKGLVKRVTVLKDASLTDEYGAEIEQADVTEELTVKEITLK